MPKFIHTTSPARMSAVWSSTPGTEQVKVSVGARMKNPYKLHSKCPNCKTPNVCEYHGRGVEKHKCKKCDTEWTKTPQSTREYIDFIKKSKKLLPKIFR